MNPSSIALGLWVAAHAAASLATVKYPVPVGVFYLLDFSAIFTGLWVVFDAACRRRE